LGEPGPSAGLPPAELRDNDSNINVAQTQFWSMNVEHQLFPNAILNVSYSGAHGVHLYDLANINLAGAGNFYLNDPVVTGTDPVSGTTCPWTNPVSNEATCYTRLNSQYTNINKRGSMGSSSYNGLNVKFQAQDIHKTGVSLIANYTFSHSLDDLSTTFSESLSNGSLGYTTYTHPQLDYASSDYDIRHRFVLCPSGKLPGLRLGGAFWHRLPGDGTFRGSLRHAPGFPSRFTT